MACGIRIAQESEGWTVHLAGRLTATEVDELFRVCEDASRPLRIDLTDLLSLDATGFGAIQQLVASGARLVGVPPSVRNNIDHDLQ